MSDKENEAQEESVDSQATTANQLELPDNNVSKEESVHNPDELIADAACTDDAQREQDHDSEKSCELVDASAVAEDELDDASEDEPVAASSEENPSEELGEGDDDPLGEAYDLDQGERLPSDVHHDEKLPWKSKIESAKEFFNTEILYRHDILLAEERDRISGSYRIELKGYQGGIWSLDVGDDIEVVNRREDADVVLAMQQKDFLRVVNGELNPQLALLSRKIKVTGDIKKAVALQSLLAPSMD
jgi:hypothetical protein